MKVAMDRGESKRMVLKRERRMASKAKTGPSQGRDEGHGDWKE